MKQKELVNSKLTEATSYEEYFNMLEELFAQGKTTGEDQSDSMLEYASLNLHRMKRINKTYKIDEETKNKFNQLNNNYIWLVITEGWCGDAAQILPILNRIASESSFIELKVVLRDQNLDLMDEFLTNGARSIPKLILINKDSGDIEGVWGPRPKENQDMVMEFKNNPSMSYTEFSKKVQLWYAKDKGKSIEKEICQLMRNCSEEQ